MSANNKAELLSERLDIPSDISAGSAKLSVYGKSKVLIENHKGILHYGENIIELSAKGMTVRILGDELSIAAMDKNDMLITGRILSLELD